MHLLCNWLSRVLPAFLECLLHSHHLVLNTIQKTRINYLRRGVFMLYASSGYGYLGYFVCCQSGREGRETYGFKKRRLNPCSSTTNQEKRKKKVFMMVRHNKGIRHKKKRSFREKQARQPLPTAQIQSLY